MCRYQDPDYPEWFTGYFPRILLPHRNLGADYEIVCVRDIIGPASISDDLSLMHYDPADEAAARQKHLKQPRSRKASVQRKKMMQELPDLNWPLIPTKFHCPHKKCTRRGCTLLHSDQYAGGHIDETHLKVVNLLVLEFSRGVWKQCWSQVIRKMVGRYILYTVFTGCITWEHHSILYRTRCTTHILPFHLYMLIYCILYAKTGYIQYTAPGLCIPQCILYTTVVVYSIPQQDSVYNHVYCIPQWDSVDMDVRIQYTEHTYSLQMYTVYIVDSFILINEEDMDLPHC